MSSMLGRKIKISVFGESHGAAIGVVIDSLPAGFEIDLDKVNFEMSRRAPGKSKLTTGRQEKDQYEIVSGFFEGKTTGTPLCSMIRNSDTRSGDYSLLKDIVRPGHADLTGKMRYLGANDYRGGGHFSGRLTAPIVFAGAVAKQILEKRGIHIGSHILSLAGVKDKEFDPINVNIDDIKNLKNMTLPLLDPTVEEKMKDEVLKARENLDSVGGIIETVVLNMPGGIGSPIFDSVESVIASGMFSVPAVKGVEFGRGFDIASMKGSEANDEYYLDNGEIKTYSNNNGGILGGITSGAPILFKVAIKPTPSISRPQRSVNVSTMEDTNLEIVGRHDPCILPRAAVVVEAVTALCILDLLAVEEV
ncbi:chorismate synthase [Clostridium cylindrosporum]|uniref:Chorismate synthase n=1 Tax=Clostridium cylindrosporum DSM 605 TaxID=1121307 RepID=A0A0J8DER6_CLOCY|nr:chorismate synthase [Clostridium cylindrosporum]KMT22724.1 chorismate synthase AroC [Clostridium cylindrosporum DSM 605]